jgi:3',5'-cyclic AMP phosphodiesterase CpdA
MVDSYDDLSPTFKYAVISDTHIRPSGESSSPWKTNLLTNDRARWVAHTINAHSPDLVIHLGDIVHPVPHLPTYSSASKRAQEIMGSLTSPYYLVPGNHDVGARARSFTDTSRRRNESSRVDEGEGERQRHKIKHPETARQIE